MKEWRAEQPTPVVEVTYIEINQKKNTETF